MRIAMRSPFSLLSLALQCANVLCLSIPKELGNASYDTIESRDDTPKPRDVFTFSDVNWASGRQVGRDVVFFMHSGVYVQGNEVDGPLKIEYNMDLKVAPMEEAGLHLRVFDMTHSKSGRAADPSGSMEVAHVGQTTLKNMDLWNPNDGTGAIVDAWLADPEYRVGNEIPEAQINDCNVLAQRLVNRLGLRLPDEANKYFQNSMKWQSTRADVEKLKVDMRFMHHIIGGNVQSFKLYQRGVVGPVDPTACMDTRGGKMKRAGGECKLTFDKDLKEPFNPQSELAASPDAEKRYGKDQLAVDTDEDANYKAPADGKSITTALDGSKTVIARANGALKVFTSVSKVALEALGVVGTAVGALFVILDLVDKEWVGAAMGAVGLAVGVGVGLAASGPVGWLIGAAVAAFFSILPGLFNGPKLGAKLDDVQGIVQWKFFGDSTVTGNEGCQKGTDDVPGNKDCQALYGTGTIASALGMSNFDAMLLMIQYNDGYPMTIPDMAKAFGSNDGIASFDCDNKGPTQGIMGGSGWVGDDPTRCNNPTFKIDGTKVNLPDLGTTGDKIRGRIIPAANGDCKLITYPGDQNLPDLGVTINGFPSAIACGLTADTKVDGTVLSTDGNPGAAYVPPPPRKPFAELSPKDYPCLSIGDETPFCLPQGKYRGQSKLGFESSKVDTLTLPSDQWGLLTHWKGAAFSDPNTPDNPTDGKPDPLPANPAHHWRRRDNFAEVSNTYKKNVSPKTSSKDDETKFTTDMDSIYKNVDGEGWFQVLGPNDGPNPVCCLFSEVSFGGNVWCAGEGGGDVLPQWKDVAKSLSCHGGAQAVIYAKEYGDTGCQTIKGNSEDLSQEVYGDSTFSENVKAWWISKIQ